MRRRLHRSIHEIQRKNLQGRESYYCWSAQQRQRPLAHSTSTKRNRHTTFTALGQRRHQKRKNQTRPRGFPPCLRLQSTILHLPPCNPTQAFRFLARPNHDPNHQALTEITRHQQRASTHETAKHPIDQDHHRPRPRYIARHHPNPRAQQPMNEGCLRCYHPNRKRSTQVLLRPNRQIPSTIFARLQLRNDPIRL